MTAGVAAVVAAGVAASVCVLDRTFIAYWARRRTFLGSMLSRPRLLDSGRWTTSVGTSETAVAGTGWVEATPAVGAHLLYAST